MARSDPSHRRRGLRAGPPSLAVPGRARNSTRWLRRALALACLLLAGLSAARSAARPHEPESRVTAASGQHVVPVTVVGADLRAYIAPGDVVELISATEETSLGEASAPAVVVLSSHATVLSMRQTGDGVGGADTQWQLVVAVSEAEARSVAANQGKPVTAIESH